MAAPSVRLVADLATPALVVDRARLEANLRRMQERARAAGVALRPHAKTHKTAEVAQQQLAHGAAGLTVATADEAEALARAGFDDLRLASPASARTAERLAALAARGTRVSLTVDTEAGTRLASRAFEASGATADVLVEIDTGHGRCGVPWDDPDVVALAAHAASLPGLRLAGVLTHGGFGYDGPREGETPGEALVRAMQQERDRLLHAASRLGDAGLLDASTAEVSLGSTPTASVFEPADAGAFGGFRVTELRPGTYVFGDAGQAALGATTLDACALTCVATVLSRHRRADGTERLIVDAGKKALSADRAAATGGWGLVLYSPTTMLVNPHAALVALSEEHGWIDVPGGSVYRVGDPVFLVPAHACMAVAHHAALHVADGDEVVDMWATLGRR